MSTIEVFNRDVKTFKESEIDDLLSKLTKEELEELHLELVDSDDPHIPPSDRCRYKTDKEASGPFDRQKLLEYLETKAAKEKDWADAKPYVKETRGKVWKPKEADKVVIRKDLDDVVETEWDEALKSATEDELVDLAAVLGFHGLLNQNQYHHAFVSGKQAAEIPGGLQSITKCEPCKQYENEPANDTDVELSLRKLIGNDATLTELNLNNIKEIPNELLLDIFNSLKSNTVLEKLHLANIGLTDKPAKVLAEAIRENRRLTMLNVESNFLSGQTIADLVRSVNCHQTIVDLKVANQRPQVLGVKSEMEIAELVKRNKTLLKFSIFLEVPAARIEISKSLQANNDALRQVRVDKKI
ncbi:hypothetical protein HELRODRAFT_105912 [Helobdella robusta]|uniref:Tropomodulin n=1 Tax=Helobdella robusta TaxID=6412 RepID=T1EDY6_HELRO|nr:hypothetical protein HELRODRAFT_105912 [Helobdella robusta]ESO05905.1 hypothetical protein HELRODRAFT_105912 [Helobdella robusta]